MKKTKAKDANKIAPWATGRNLLKGMRIVIRFQSKPKPTK